MTLLIDNLPFVYASAHTGQAGLNTYERLCAVTQAFQQMIAPQGRRLATSHWRTIIIVELAAGLFSAAIS